MLLGTRRFRTGCLLSLALLLARPPEAAACEPIPFTVEYVLPISNEVPLNGSMLAYVEAPGSGLEDQVSLLTMGGEVVPIEVVVERNASHEAALVHASPIDPLEPNSSYVWSVGSYQQVFTTGDEIDVDAPSFAEVIVSKGEVKSAPGCFGSYEWQEYILEVTGVDEPVAVYVHSGPDGEAWGFAAVYDAPLAIAAPLAPEQDVCYELFIEDHGGNVVSTQSACLGLLDGDGDGDGDDTEESGDTGETGTSGDTETGGPGFDAGEKACACRTDDSQNHGAAALLLLAALGLRRRRYSAASSA